MSCNPNNNGTYIGRLVRTPELHKTQKGTAVTSFTLAVDRNRPDADGNWKADFIDFVAWAVRAEKICEKWKQGDLVAVTGPLQIRAYKNKEGKTVSRAEIIVDGTPRKLSTAMKNAMADMPELPEDYDYAPFPTDSDFTELDDPGEMPL